MVNLKNCAAVINSKRAEIGMTTRALATKSGIEENALYLTFGGKRALKASELLTLSYVLGLNLSDYLETA